MAVFWEKYCGDVVTTFKSKYLEMMLKDISDDERWNGILSGDVGYRKVILPMLNLDVVKQVFLPFIPKHCLKKSGDIMRVEFQDMCSFEPFMENFQLRVCNKDDNTFVCPYAYMSQSFGVAQFEEYQDFFKSRGWNPVFLDTSINTSYRKYNSAREILVLVKREVHKIFQGKPAKFYHISWCQIPPTILSI